MAVNRFDRPAPFVTQRQNPSQYVERAFVPDGVPQGYIPLPYEHLMQPLSNMQDRADTYNAAQDVAVTKLNQLEGIKQVVGRNGVMETPWHHEQVRKRAKQYIDEIHDTVNNYNPTDRRASQQLNSIASRMAGDTELGGWLQEAQANRANTDTYNAANLVGPNRYRAENLYSMNDNFNARRGRISAAPIADSFDRLKPVDAMLKDIAPEAWEAAGLSAQYDTAGNMVGIKNSSGEEFITPERVGRVLAAGVGNSPELQSDLMREAQHRYENARSQNPNLATSVQDHYNHLVNDLASYALNKYPYKKTKQDMSVYNDDLLKRQREERAGAENFIATDGLGLNINNHLKDVWDSSVGDVTTIDPRNLNERAAESDDPRFRQLQQSAVNTYITPTLVAEYKAFSKNHGRELDDASTTNELRRYLEDTNPISQFSPDADNSRLGAFFNQQTAGGHDRFADYELHLTSLARNRSQTLMYTPSEVKRGPATALSESLARAVSNTSGAMTIAAIGDNSNPSNSDRTAVTEALKNSNNFIVDDNRIPSFGYNPHTGQFLIAGTVKVGNETKQITFATVNPETAANLSRRASQVISNPEQSAFLQSSANLNSSPDGLEALRVLRETPVGSDFVKLWGGDYDSIEARPVQSNVGAAMYEVRYPDGTTQVLPEQSVIVGLDNLINPRTQTR